MSKVYLVTRGSYSDYSVSAVFSTQKAAQEYMKAVGGKYADWNAIEEYEMDPPAVRRLKDGYRVWSVTMRHDGTVEQCYVNDTEPYVVESAPSYRIWERTKVPAYRGQSGVVDALQASVWAKTLKQAVKVVNERRAAMIASGEWVREGKEPA